MKYLLRFAALAVLIGLVGCSQPRAKVSGNVTVAGKPLTGGSIRFELISDPSTNGGGQIHADGTYDVPDAPIGECRVIVENEGLKIGGKMAGSGTMPGGGGGPPNSGGMMKGGPPGMGKSSPPGGGGGMGGAPETAKKKMDGGAEGPKNAKIDQDMPKNEDAGKLKYVKIDKTFSGSESPLRFTVNKGASTYNAEVK